MVKIRKIYIGVAWPYVNDLFHLGNLTGAYLPPDIFRRFHKLSGNEVLMISGSDFHGTPITLQAEKEGVKPEGLAQKYHLLDKEYLQRFRIEYSLYTSTHTVNHRRVTQEMFLRLLKNGYIKILKTKQLYSETAGKFLQDRYIEGECPYCHCLEARGDQCEKCGRALDALELINPYSKIDRSKLVARETENYFLDLKKLQPVIKKWLSARKGWRDWVKNEALGWVEEGLRPRAITRDLNYGVALPIKQIPQNQRIENIENKILYVWFEAVIGYLSGAVEYSQKIKKPNYWKKFFYDPQAETYYFVGQDNLVFHTINWPAQLYAYDEKINLPTNVFVNKFLLLEGRKMSKSRGWFLNNQELLQNYAADSLRFYLALNLPETKEFSFGWEDFIKTNNNVLVATIGNFINRAFSLAKNNFGRSFVFDKKTVSREVEAKIKQTLQLTEKQINQGQFKEALAIIVDFCVFGNQFLERTKPWEKIKTNRNEAEMVIKNSLIMVANLKTLIYPFLPESAEKLNQFLGFPKISFKIGLNQWQYQLPKRIRLAKEIKPLFAKIPKEQIVLEKEKLVSKNYPPSRKATEGKPTTPPAGGLLTKIDAD